jgi:hypothetical protein
MRYADLPLHQNDKGIWYFEDWELAKTHDRKGPVRLKLNDFVNKHELRESHSNKHPSWVAVLPLVIQRSMRLKCTNEFRPKGNFADFPHDHHWLFVKNRKYVYVTQPYDVSLGKYQAIENTFRPLGLFVDISYKDAWWWPGATPLIVISQFPISLTKE